MNQDNSTRLKEEFRFAAKGARCRTATFINPNFAALGQSEWMEAECANGRDWNIKTMKIVPGYATGGELLVEQNYLSEYCGLTFGAIVLKMVEYERAQNALGFLSDENDTAAQAGAPPFREIAVRAGIVFNADGDPVASVHGLVVQPGRYPISAFRAAYDAMQMNRKAPALTTPGTLPIQRRLSCDQMMDEIKIASLLNEITNELKEMATGSVLGWAGGNPFRPGYSYFVKFFDKKFAELRRMEQPFSPIENFDARLNLFKFHAFRIAGAWAVHTIKNGKSAYSKRRSIAVVEDALHRCQEAAQAIGPGIEIDLSVMDFSQASKGDASDPVPDLGVLKEMVAAIEALSVPPAQGGHKPPGPE